MDDNLIPKTVQDDAVKPLMKMAHLMNRVGVIQFTKLAITHSALYGAVGAITGRAIPMMVIQKADHADYICHAPWFRELKEFEYIPLYRANLKETNRILGEPVYEVEFEETGEVSAYKFTSLQ
jgi:hypothetical protein